MSPVAIDLLLTDCRRRERSLWLWLGLLGASLAAAFAYAGFFELARYRGALTTLLTLAGESLPPDFSRWPSWGRPLAETLAMSAAGTVLATLAALPLGALAARTLAPDWIGAPIRLLLGGIRAVPGLIWGVMFVAALGFGPMPGIVALACHSTGVLGKLVAEMLEHVDPAPGLLLRSQGCTPAGVFRFATWPQILPRLVDAVLYRWDHNVRAATTLGVVGAGGLGLEIVTAFHLFNYREASALVLVVLGLVTLLGLLGGMLRRRQLDHR